MLLVISRVFVVLSCVVVSPLCGKEDEVSTQGGQAVGTEAAAADIASIKQQLVLVVKSARFWDESEKSSATKYVAAAAAAIYFKT